MDMHINTVALLNGPYAYGWFFRITYEVTAFLDFLDQ